MRTDVLRRTVGHRNHTSSDNVMLSDLALRGPFHLVREPLFTKRWLEGNRYQERSPARMAWSEPDLARSGRPTLPHWMELEGYIAVVGRAPVAFAEKIRCFTVVAAWAVRRWRALGWDLAFAGLMLTHSKKWRQACYAPDRWVGVKG